MDRKRILAVLLSLVLLLTFCGCDQPAETGPAVAEAPTTLPAETEAASVAQPQGPENPDGTFTIRLGKAAVNVAPPEGAEDKGHGAEKVILGREDDGYFVQYSVIEVPGDLETTGKAMFEAINDTCARASDNGIQYQRMTDEVTVNALDFKWDILTLQPEDRPSRTAVRAWAPLLEEDGMSYYVELSLVLNSSGETEIQFTGDDIGPWLEAVSPVA